MNDFPKIKEHYDMSQRKYTKAIPFQWKKISCSATGISIPPKTAL